jgi:hypothetical protein
MHKINFFLFFVLPFLLVGCEKFLDKNPENQVSVDELFTDIVGAKAALTGVYYNLWSTGYYNGPRMIYPEAVGGNVKPLNTPRQTLLDVYHFTAVADSASMNGMYASVYAMLNSINIILERVPAIQQGMQTERNNILAQAYGLRALLHLDLVHMYAQPYGFTPDASHLGVVVAAEPILVGDAQRSRSSVAEVYAQIESDLGRSEELFGNHKTVFTGRASAYITLSAIQALKARVFLDRKQWQQAYDYANTVVEGNYTLYSSTEYVHSWASVGGKETIFELTRPNNHTGNSLGSYYVDSSRNNYYQFVPSKDLLDLFSAGDVRHSGGIFKYSTYGADATSVKLIRISEMYLIRAEAAAELGLQERALADLNSIRLRADPDLAPWTATGQTELIDEIFQERRRELCLEGFYFFDLMRAGRSVVREDCIGENCQLTYPSERFVQPIPRQSVDSNPNMQQNPGY